MVGNYALSVRFVIETAVGGGEGVPIPCPHFAHILLNPHNPHVSGIRGN